jgi:hypothetical protein
MSPLRFELALPQDDAELRQLLAATPMAGKVSVSFRREPSFFGAAVVEGEFHQTIVAREISNGRIVALGSRSVRRRLINGAPTPVGYLGGLRVLPQYRGSRVLAHGYRFLRELHNDARAQIYLTTIAEGNDAALSVLISGRAGLPRYEYFGNYHTGVIPLRRTLSSSSAVPGIVIRAARAEDLAQLCQFFARIGAGRQFFTCYTLADWCKETGTFRGLCARDIFLALRGTEIVGTFACWDQSSFRQIVVEEYGSALAWSAPVYNGWAALRGLPKLPQPGESLPFLTAALPLVAAEDRQIFAALLEAAIAHSLGRGRSHILVGMHERDPLISVVKQFQTEAYTTRCYLVYWEDGIHQREWIDGRVPYLELGCL